MSDATSMRLGQKSAIRRLCAGVALLLVACGSDDEALPQGLCDPDARGLVLHELMPDPAGEDAGREWLELINLGPHPVALGRLTLTVGSLDAPKHVPLGALGWLAPGALVVLGNGTSQSAPIDAGYGAFDMPNDAGVVALHCQGTLQTAVVYGATPQRAHDVCMALGALTPPPAAGAGTWGPRCLAAPSPQAGQSLSLDTTEREGPIWHRTLGPSYDRYNTGTPRAANLGRKVCTPSDGVWRRMRAPRAGEVRIAAVYADPPGPDDGGEWLVLRVTGEVPVDLTGLGLSAEAAGHRPRLWALEGPGCHTAWPGHDVRVRIMTLKAPVQARLHEGMDLVLWGQTLPNSAMQLTLRFAENSGANDGDKAVACDVLCVPKATRGVVYVRPEYAPDSDVRPPWPQLLPQAPSGRRGR